MSIDWNLVGDGIKTGRYNLLLGAGVSLDSESGITGQNCPSAGELRAELERALPDVRPGSSLSRLYKTMTDAQKEQLITRRFRGCAPGETVNAISMFRWRRIFTLNVDDALERAYESAPVPVQRHASINFDDIYSEVRDSSEVQIIHLHGFARDPDSAYVFEVKDYMRSVRENNIWAHVLGSLIRSEPFIVMGSSLEEPDLSYFLADRSNVIERIDRPPSILVEPFLDAATKADGLEYSMQLYEGTSLKFLEEVDRRVPVRPSVLDSIEENLKDIVELDVSPVALAEFHSDFDRVPNSTLGGPDGGTRFAYGHLATWKDIQNGRDLARAETADLQAKLALGPSNDMLLIEGLAGSGKTTLLRRLAWNLAQAGHRCLYLNAIGRIRIDSAFEVLNRLPERTFVFVDNFADNVSEIAILARRLKGRDARFIGAERSYRLGHIKRVIAGEPLETFWLGDTGTSLATQLVETYKNYGLVSSELRRKEIPPLSSEVIAVACCRILNNFEPLDTIIDRSMKDSAPSAQECYVFASLAAYCYRLGIEYDLISFQFPDYQVDRQTDDIVPLPLRIEEFSDVEFVLPLNDAVADSILRRYAERFPSMMIGIFSRLAKAIRPRVSIQAVIDGEPSARTASRLFDFDEVVEPLLGLDGAERFYADAHEEWSWNSRYWHQIAQFRLEKADRATDIVERRQMAEQAVQHIRFAKTIEPNHQFTLTTLGSILFGKMRLLDRVDPADLEEAIEALIRAMQIERNRGRVTVHPFMILFKGLTYARTLGAVLSFDQRSTVQGAITTAQEEFPRDRDLMEEAARVRAGI